jgi:hypothetical protein
MFQYLYKYKCIHVYHQKEIKPFLPDLFIKAIFHCSRFARAGGATNFNHVKNQSPGHAKKVECSSTFMACPRAVRRTKNAQVRQLQRKLSNVRFALHVEIKYQYCVVPRTSPRQHVNRGTYMKRFVGDGYKDLSSKRGIFYYILQPYLYKQ